MVPEGAKGQLKCYIGYLKDPNQPNGSGDNGI
jgi:hypothetical protein